MTPRDALSGSMLTAIYRSLIFPSRNSSNDPIHYLPGLSHFRQCSCYFTLFLDITRRLIMPRTQAEPGKYAEPMSITVTRDEEERGWDLRREGGFKQPPWPTSSHSRAEKLGPRHQNHNKGLLYMGIVNILFRSKDGALQACGRAGVRGGD